VQAVTFRSPVELTPVISQRGELFQLPGQETGMRNPFDDWQAGSIAIIPLTGLMLKRGYRWSYGVDDIASIIRLAYQSASISAVILKADTPGGAVDSLFLIQEVLSEKTKPTYGYIDGMAASCGYIALSYCDKIYAINPVAYAGSIGVYPVLYIPNREKEWYTIREIYPDESKDKNLPERETVNGNDDLLKERLSKLALHLRETVKSNRPGVSDETLTGKLYYAEEAVTPGLIDGIKTLQQAVERLAKLTENRKQVLSII
jgi:protease-4